MGSGHIAFCEYAVISVSLLALKDGLDSPGSRDDFLKLTMAAIYPVRRCLLLGVASDRSTVLNGFGTKY